jgi:hypothetical protein
MITEIFGKVLRSMWKAFSFSPTVAAIISLWLSNIQRTVRNAELLTSKNDIVKRGILCEFILENLFLQFFARLPWHNERTDATAEAGQCQFSWSK